VHLETRCGHRETEGDVRGELHPFRLRVRPARRSIL
jgi:hypothetical protein